MGGCTSFGYKSIGHHLVSEQLILVRSVEVGQLILIVRNPFK